MTVRHCLKRALSHTLLVMLAPLPSQAAKGSVLGRGRDPKADGGLQRRLERRKDGGGVATLDRGRCLHPYSQSAVGKSAVAAAYDKVFAVLLCATDFPEAGRVVREARQARVRGTGGSAHLTERDFPIG